MHQPPIRRNAYMAWTESCHPAAGRDASPAPSEFVRAYKPHFDPVAGAAPEAYPGYGGLMRVA